MAGKEVREYTNLSDPKDKKWGKGKDKIDDEDITFQRMVAKMQEVAGERGGYLHGRGALDSDDLLYLKEQMEAEEDAERLLRRTEKRAFAAFKISFFHYENFLADSAPASVPLALRVEPKPKSGIRQQDLLKRVVEVKPKRPRVSNLSDLSNPKHDNNNDKVKENPLVKTNKTEGETEAENPVKSLLGLAYASSDDEDE
ncbi:Ankyrin repeat domain-containing protein 50 isoform 1 [Cucumis melo var. makuwa]|uniref:Ankyrin repeat domain-containing protein 50 isoform 1 n=1 Tax=Cucumis melo var. makuwa TaxID=1194695 RepID=A0A5A7T1G4_CUCMM|nr:Ankyrin repeat domain-containing protein 50 isoform 1 [Cucumis melo var. makuwa]